MTSSPTPATGLSGRTALVTGAASGIGRAVAAQLAAAGAEVILLDRDQQGAEEAAREVGGEPMTADLGDHAAIADLGLRERGIDVLVNNAGIQHVAPIEDFDPERFALIH
ncbi:MAG: bdhA 2, partial [Marmoricola sp.]|nr:bdhA 2 [Marmoricola sp.]